MKNFKILVLATMSSGKSTLINALAGIDLLPCKNQACTSKVIEITDNDKAQKFCGYAIDKDGKQQYFEIIDMKLLTELNDNPNIDKIIINGDFPGVYNTQYQATFIDTPGPNNANNEKHRDLTLNLISDKSIDLVLYVLNATQLGTDDDSELLTKIAEELQFNKDKFLFVINKIDQIDIEGDESIEDIVKSSKEYLMNRGIKEPNIIPISSYAAKLFKTLLIEGQFTKKAEIDMDFYFNMFVNPNYNMLKHSHLNSEIIKQTTTSQLLVKKRIGQSKWYNPISWFPKYTNDFQISLKQKEYNSIKVHNALKSTGLLLIENYINSILK